MVTRYIVYEQDRKPG